jgi:hypothetical protein
MLILALYREVLARKASLWLTKAKRIPNLIPKKLFYKLRERKGQQAKNQTID